MGRIRQFAPDDIPAVVALRRKAFRHSERPSADDLGAYLEEIFFRNPWRDEAIPSLIYANATGAIEGYIGVVPRPAQVHDIPTRTHVGSCLMGVRTTRGLHR